ncbi:MAG TPA: 16S rRNA (guanine(527)-N(7))-methyltransferase RsmG [Burkholderiales bacterium]|nr:16S rRNA (guanine(527)-N(7))-methyltransferase RsmG [Burkholderiales bacterium]
MSGGDTLGRGVAALGLDLSAGVRMRFMQYIALLQKWNSVYSLTAVHGATEMVTHHVLDSLAVLPYVGTGSIVDVGSGAGLPGIPLALAKPDASVILLDSNQKKAAFLRQAVIELGLDNAEVVCARAEVWQPAKLFEVVISRAFSDLRRFVELAGRLCAPHGMLAAMRGVYLDSELDEVPPAFTVKRAVPLSVPGLNAMRHLILLQPTTAAP